MNTTGKIVSLNGDVIEIEFEKGQIPRMNTLLESETGIKLTTEIIVSDTLIRALIISQDSHLALNEKVTSTGKPIQAPVGANALGRIFNVFGEIIDGGEEPKDLEYVDVRLSRRGKSDFVSKGGVVETGIKVIDFFLPIRQGDKFGMFGGAGVGKTLIIKEIINNLSTKTKNSNSIFVGIGERSREGEEIYKEFKDANLLDKVALIFAQMNETPGARMKVIYSALTMAEHFRDVMKEDTYMFIDNIYRFTQAGSEISSSLGNIPSQSGYQPTLLTEVSAVQERISNNKNGSITAFQTVFVPADDITDPAVVAIFTHLDGSLVLDRKIAAEGKYPAINALKSNSNNLQEKIVGRRHLAIATKAKMYLQRYYELEDLLAVLGTDGLSPEDKLIVRRARKLTNFFTQNLFTAEEFTQRPGDWVTVEQTISSVEQIMNGEFDELSSADFLYISDTKRLKRKLEKLSKIEEEMNMDDVGKRSLRRKGKQRDKTTEINTKKLRRRNKKSELPVEAVEEVKPVTPKKEEPVVEEIIKEEKPQVEQEKIEPAKKEKIDVEQEKEILATEAVLNEMDELDVNDVEDVEEIIVESPEEEKIEEPIIEEVAKPEPIIEEKNEEPIEPEPIIEEPIKEEVIKEPAPVEEVVQEEKDDTATVVLNAAKAKELAKIEENEALQKRIQELMKAKEALHKQNEEKKQSIISMMDDEDE